MYRIVMVLSLSLVLALAVWLSRRSWAIGWSTPAACLDAYCAASMAGDTATYLTCLDEPLRAEVQRRFSDPDALGEHLRRESRDIRSWVQWPQPTESGNTATVVVEEVRTSGQRRVQYRLTHRSRGWRITAIDKPTDVQAVVPYGTDVREGP